MRPKKALIFFAFFLALLYSGTSYAASITRPLGDDPSTYEGVTLYIPINDQFIYNLNDQLCNGYLHGWAIMGADVESCEPESGNVGGRAESTTKSSGVIELNTIPIERTFNVVLDSDTPLDATFNLVLDRECATETRVPSASETLVATGMPLITANNNLRKKGDKIEVTLNNGTASVSVYVYLYVTVGNTFTHTFNFTIADADASNDPDPQDVSSIQVTPHPDHPKTTYFEGNVFDRSSVVVTANLKAGGTAPIAGYAVSPDGPLSPDDTAVTITFGTHSDQQAITVLPSVSLSDVKIENGQLFGEWEAIGLGLSSSFEKKQNKYDAVAWYGEPVAKFSFRAGESAEVYVGDEKISPTEPGLYELELPAGNDTEDSVEAFDGGVVSVVTVKAGEREAVYTFNCFVQCHDGMPAEVTEYLSIASQYTNGANMNRAYGLNPVSTLRGKFLDATTGSMYSGPTSLGNFGGYIVYRYKEPIRDDPNNPYGVDFIVYGNCVDPRRGFAEPGNVLVSENGTDWHTLAGSAHYEDHAKWNARMTYTNQGGEVCLEYVRQYGYQPRLGCRRQIPHETILPALSVDDGTRE